MQKVDCCQSYVNQIIQNEKATFPWNPLLTAAPPGIVSFGTKRKSEEDMKRNI